MACTVGDSESQGQPDGGPAATPVATMMPDGGPPETGTPVPQADGGCSASSDCGDGGTCDLLAGACVLTADLADLCDGVACAENERCRDGACVQLCDGDPCEGVRCPERHECNPRNGACVLQDFCAEVNCPVGSGCDPTTGRCESAGQAPDGEVGAACTRESQCLAAGVRSFCFPERFSIFPDGYCTSDCSRGVPCPEGSGCAFFSGRSVCLRGCFSDTDCRENYTCARVGRLDGRACVPMDESLCRNGTVGTQSCDDDGDCREGGVCDLEAGSCACSVPGDRCGSTQDCETGLRCLRSLPGGLCTPATCDLANPLGGSCPQGTACVPLHPEGSACAPVCTQSGACREGYTCTPAADGNRVCRPRECGEDGDCNTACRCTTATKDCPNSGRCDETGYCSGATCTAATALEDCGSPHGCGADGRCRKLTCDIGAGRCDPFCESDADCGDGDQRGCDLDTGSCFVRCQGLDADGLCGPEAVCNAFTGRCVARCDADAQCAEDEVCDPAFRRCVGRCMDDADCARRPGREGAVCDGERGLCLLACPPLGVCPGRTQCYGDPRRCLPPCTSDGDCLPGDYCDHRNERCRAPCSSDDDCDPAGAETCHPTQRCDPACSFDFQCRLEAGETCNRRRGHCEPPNTP